MENRKMKIIQLSIFLENKPGRLAAVTEVLNMANINIQALSLADTLDFGVLRLMVDDSAKAVKALEEKKISVAETVVSVVQVPDRPGGLHRILKIIEKENINLEYMYSYMSRKKEDAIMIFQFGDPENAEHLLNENGINVLKLQELHAL